MAAMVVSNICKAMETWIERLEAARTKRGPTQEAGGFAGDLARDAAWAAEARKLREEQELRGKAIAEVIPSCGVGGMDLARLIEANQHLSLALLEAGVGTAPAYWTHIGEARRLIESVKRAESDTRTAASPPIQGTETREQADR